ncbi:excisionase [Thiopseudomonas alkaliphila]|uniref:Excisionase n=1 Tax=Thiopseudomonas alkaliphila TaxID=1697053 RepID=A0A0K1XGX7_9GAMM|nr:excisionase [Thiopseudomonas alkaliphila]AKX60437.1 excisionase [Thiopseudomonas alkaliphila]
MVKYKTIRQFSKESGYTEAAIRKKIADNIWPEDLVWFKAPDGRNLISVEGYAEWVESSAEYKQFQQRRSRSTFGIKGAGSVNASHLSPPPLI